ncbi:MULTISPECIES: hypothetical protein [unclassified Exiguobacterium]|uniref:hypothetical protein n=1 Tax=unclassified Exiguobacterium TaxID=2644629 RepID=UPI002036D7A5|nr:MULTISPECIES: hypothetical protein [unclassified Exiguobacterium]
MSFNGGSKKMQWLSSNEADWERRHPVTLLFYLFCHLYILMNVEDVTLFVVGLLLLLIIERRFPWSMLSILIAFGLISIMPILIGWEISYSYIWRQLLKLAAFLLGMLWIARIMRLERLLPLLSNFPRSSSLLYGAWALIPSMEQAVRQAVRSHPRASWREGVQIGIESQQTEPKFAVDPIRRFRLEDLLQIVLIGMIGLASIHLFVGLWLIYPYLTKGGMRDAMVIYR